MQMPLRFRRFSPGRYLIFRGKTEIGKIVKLDVYPAGRTKSAWSVVHRKLARGLSKDGLFDWQYYVGKRHPTLEQAKAWAERHLAEHGYVEAKR